MDDDGIEHENFGEDHDFDQDDDDGNGEPVADTDEEKSGDDEEDEDSDAGITEVKKKVSDDPIYIFGDERNLKNNFITKFEYASLIGNRANQIEESNPPVHPLTLEIIKRNGRKDLTFSLDIAKFELDNRSIPFEFYIFRRISIRPEKYEIWEPRELTIPHELICKEISEIKNILSEVNKSCLTKNEEQFDLDCKKFSSSTNFL